MYAVIVTGGKQYRVTAGSIIEVEKLDVNVGDTIKIDQVLALSGDKNVIGSPTVAGALVEAQVLEQGKADKVLIFKKKRRHNYRRKNGHRQRFTALHILSIALNGTALVTAEKRTPKPRATTPQPEGAVSAKPAKVKATAPKAKAAVKPAAKKAPAAAKKPAAKKAAK
jgi:large subunit ribosomal protein L21